MTAFHELENAFEVAVEMLIRQAAEAASLADTDHRTGETNFMICEASLSLEMPVRFKFTTSGPYLTPHFGDIFVTSDRLLAVSRASQLEARDGRRFEVRPVADWRRSYLRAIESALAAVNAHMGRERARQRLAREGVIDAGASTVAGVPA